MEDADREKSHAGEQCQVEFRVPGQADHRREIEALSQHPTLVVNAGIIRPADPVHPRRTQSLLDLPEQCGRRGRIVLTFEESKKSGLVRIPLVVGAVDNRRNSADRTSVAAGNEGLDFSVPEMKCRFRGKILRNATGKRRNECRIRSVQVLRHPLEHRPLRRCPAGGNRTRFFCAWD